MSKFDYRKFYKGYYRLEFGKEFDIHHIDKDRSNNSINNLILLPKKVHHSYHLGIESLSLIEMWGNEMFPFDVVHIKKHEEVLVKLYNVNRIVTPWVLFKKQLDDCFYYDNDCWEKVEVREENGRYVAEKIFKENISPFDTILESKITIIQ